MLRLIRAVADFPNVIYVLSYDGDVFEAHPEVPQVGGRLPKVVQVSFQVPLPRSLRPKALVSTTKSTHYLHLSCPN